MTYVPAGLHAPIRRSAWSGATAERVAIVGLAAAGLVHLTVGPEHLSESVPIGTAMLAGSIGQLALAFGVRHGVTSAWLALAIVTLNIGFIIGWLAAVTVGLPVEAHAHSGAIGLTATHGELGHSEPVTPLAVVTAGLELAVVGAVVHLRHIWPHAWSKGRRPSPRQGDTS